MRLKSGARKATGGSARLVGTTALAGAFRKHGAAQQRGEGIEAAGGIADHPAPLPGSGIDGALLGLHIEGDGEKLIAAIPEAIAVGALQHKETAPPVLKPAAWLGSVGRIIELEFLEQNPALGIAQLNPHQSAWGTSAIGVGPGGGGFSPAPGAAAAAA